MWEEQAGRCTEPQNHGLKPKFPRTAQHPAPLLSRAKEGSSSTLKRDQKPPGLRTHGEGRAGEAGKPGLGVARGERGQWQRGGGSAGAVGVGGGWYSQGGLWSQVGAAAWGDVSLRLQIDGR